MVASVEAVEGAAAASGATEEGVEARVRAALARYLDETEVPRRCGCTMKRI